MEILCREWPTQAGQRKSTPTSTASPIGNETVALSALSVHGFRPLGQPIGFINNVAHVRDRRAQNRAAFRNRFKRCNNLHPFLANPANGFEVHLYRDKFVE